MDIKRSCASYIACENCDLNNNCTRESCRETDSYIYNFCKSVRKVKNNTREFCNEFVNICDLNKGRGKDVYKVCGSSVVYFDIDPITDACSEAYEVGICSSVANYADVLKAPMTILLGTLGVFILSVFAMH
jgi:hypothetical protein